MSNSSKKCLMLFSCLALLNACSNDRKGELKNGIEDINQLIKDNKILETSSLKEIKDAATGGGQNAQSVREDDSVNAKDSPNTGGLDQKIAKRAQELIE